MSQLVVTRVLKDSQAGGLAMGQTQENTQGGMQEGLLGDIVLGEGAAVAWHNPAAGKHKQKLVSTKTQKLRKPEYSGHVSPSTRSRGSK